MRIALRPVSDADLAAIFAWQRDPVANALAAVAPRERPAFDAHWAKILADDAITKQMIFADDAPVGFALVFERGGKLELGYWIDRAHWGRGIASAAVREVLALDRRRPLYAGIALHNAGSLRVAEGHGFVRVGQAEFTDPATGRPVPGALLRLG